MKTAAGREAFEMLSAGDVGGLSIGFSVPDDGASFAGDTRRLKKINLAEISVVTIPANAAARVTAVRSYATPPATVREFEAELRDMGFSRREAATIATKGFPGAAELLSNPSEDDLAAVHARLVALVANVKRN